MIYFYILNISNLYMQIIKVKNIAFNFFYTYYSEFS